MCIKLRPASPAELEHLRRTDSKQARIVLMILQAQTVGGCVTRKQVRWRIGCSLATVSQACTKWERFGATAFHPARPVYNWHYTQAVSKRHFQN